MIPVDDFSPRELLALLQFHADAGVEWLLEEAPVDRIAEFQARSGARPAQPVTASAPAVIARTARTATESPQPRKAPERPASGPAGPVVAIPDEQAIANARAVAGEARSFDELKAALEAFTGCNLKMSARSTVFADGDPAARLMIIGPMPNADDEREGIPFSGLQGEMLERMLGAVGLSRRSALLTNAVPWRPPGNRMPSAREADICRPFIERQIALAAPDHILILGNFAARFLLGSTESIHDLRGRWREIASGGRTIPALATLHPQELISAPGSKRLAWQDLLNLRARLRGDAARA